MDYDHVKKQLGYGIQTESKDNAIKAIEQLTARVRELEEENARLKAECDDIKQVQFPRKLDAVAAGWKKQLAAAQADNNRLRDALGAFAHRFPESEVARDALASPSDTSALDAYVAQKVKEAYIPVTIDYGDGAEDVAFGNEHQARRLKKWLDKFFAQKEQITTLTRQRDNLMQQAQQHAMEARTANATLNEIYQLVSRATGEKANWNGAQPVREKLESLTRQRDLAVEAMREALECGEDGDWRSARCILASAIKESEAMAQGVTK